MKTNIVYLSALLIAGLSVSCGKPHTGHGKDTDTHQEKLALVSYGASLEIYCKTDPLVAGEKAQVLLYLTRTQDFKPQPRAAVSIRLTGAGNRVQARRDSLDRPGMCTLTLTPQKAGQARLLVSVRTAGGQPEQASIPVTVYASHSERQKAAQEQATHSGNTVTFSKEMVWKSQFSTEVCRPVPFGPALRVMAQVEPAQGEERVVVSGVPGIVRMGSTPPVEGMAVRAGQTLLTVDGNTTADGNMGVRLQEAEAAYLRAKSELERKEPLAKERIVTQSDLQDARAEYATAKAQWENLKRLSGNGRQAVTAPIAGYVAQLNVKNGQYVEAGQPLASVSSTHWLTLRAQVPQQEWRMLPHIHGANIRMAGARTVTSLDELDGSVLSYGRQVSTDTPLVPVLFRVRYTPDLLPGSWVEMFIRTETSDRALTVPAEAVIEEMGLYFIYVQLTPELFEKREVTPGGTDGRRVEVLSGIRDGERVVGSGAILVKLTQASGGVDPHAGHMH